MRLDTSLPFFVTRPSSTSSASSTTTFRKGERLILLLGAANRDPDRFDEPDRLDLGRTPNPHLAFGQGIHYCLGAQLARVEAGIAISGLLARFGSISLAVPAASLRWRPSTLIHGLEALPVRIAP